jgi:uroporphyrinogen decarboxylase
MNAFDRLHARLAGQLVDRVPNFDIFMARAAHHIGQPLSHYYQDARVLVDANLAVLEAFHLDIVQAISDPYREAADAGLKVDFPHDSLPISTQPLLVEPDDLAQLRFPAPADGRRMTDRIEAICLFRQKVGGEVPIMGWVEGALAEAADLRGVSTLLTDLSDRPDWVSDLLEVCTQNAIAFAQAQIAAGADIIGLGDAVASQISPRMYRRFALPYEQRIFAAVRALGAIPRLHICGDTTRILADMAQSGAQIIDIDWMVPMAAAAQTFAGAETGPIAVCGNLDPVAIFLQGTPADVRRGIQQNAADGGACWISSAGCEIPDGTPAENLLAQVAAL